MSLYFGIAAIVWVLAWVSQMRPQTARAIDYACLFLFVGIAGLRYHTGFDWFVYSDFFDSQQSWQTCSRGPSFEPMYAGLSALFAMVTSHVAVLFFSIAVFNAVVFYRFCRMMNGSFALAFAFYFCWIYLPLQMGVVRQSLAVSLVLLAMMALHRQQRRNATVLGFSALGFQYSAAMYLPCLVPGILQRVWRWLPLLLALSVAVFFFVPSLSQSIIDVLTDSGIDLITHKMQFYQPQVTPVSHGAIGYFALNLVFLAAVWCYSRKVVLERTDSMLLMPLFLLVLLQAVTPDLPVLWNRMQYLAIPCQAVFVARLCRRHGSHAAVAIVALAVISIGAFSYVLMGHGMKSFIPYRSVLGSASHDASIDLGRTYPCIQVWR